MIETERMTFLDGNWWEFKKQLTVGAKRAMEAVLKSAFKVEVNEAGLPELKMDWEKADFDEATRVMILASTTAWSFGEVSPAIFNNIPQSQYEQVARRCNELYAPFPVSAKGN